ncbi:MAG: response regulator [Lachnospiraceae bacterium]|nr:response regulator [Lachnospiraceae bacterium]
MRTEDQTSIHLLLATIVTIFGVFLILITLALSWEYWMIPIILVGNTLVWCLHIGRFGSESFYKNLCAGLLMIGFFFFGVHVSSLYDTPAVACMVILVFSMFDKKRLLYMIAALYVTVLLYHFLILGTITWEMPPRDMIRIGIDIAVTLGALSIARYRIKRRLKARVQYDTAITELEKAGRQNAVFLSNVSHELRTPINMVLGISEVVLEKGLPGELREDMLSIQLAGKRLSSQINNMLDYTEIVEGTLTSLKQEYMLTSVLNDIMITTAMQGNRSQLEIVFDMDPKIPAVLIGDAEKISHVLKILLENSVKFTEEGGIHLCIECRKESYGVNLVIDIYDTGIGMTDAQLNQMFDDFYQADSGSSRFAGGLGLGIPIARGLLNSMGGFIHFASKKNEGLEAHITIPQGVADDSPSIVVANADKLCIACYFRPEKYSCEEVKEYYDRMILHLVEGLGIEGYQAHNFDGLLKLQSNHTLTHVFIAQAEYEENRDYYEELVNKLRVVVIADRDFVLDRSSRLLVLHKPFSALSVANLLNGDMEESGIVGMDGRRPFSCTGIKALAVDDEEMNLVVAKGVLGSYGIDVDTCSSGREAVKRLDENDYDVIFLDHMMPGFDGVETLRRIREMNNGMYQELPVLALTANTISGAREMFRHEGFTEFIPKPIERSVLERVLRKVLPEEAIQYGVEAQPKKEAASKAAHKEEPVRKEAVKQKAVQEKPVHKEAPVPKEESPEGLSLLQLTPLVEAGMNVRLGLEYCCGEKEFYLEMLQTFAEQSEGKKTELEALYTSESWGDYAIKAHALKSTSLTIGAEELSEKARALEQAGRNGDTEYIRQNHSELLEAYDKVCRSIQELE